MIVVFVPELALRSPSLPGIGSSAKRDFVLVFAVHISRDQNRIRTQDLRRSPRQKYEEAVHAEKKRIKACLSSERCTVLIRWRLLLLCRVKTMVTRKIFLIYGLVPHQVRLEQLMRHDALTADP